MAPPSKPSEPQQNSERNEYIPSFISKKPFYIDDATASQDDYLEHQRLQNQKNTDPLATSKWYDRGQRSAPAATKYRKGACENCGGMGHKAKDCLYKMRKHGAKWTGSDIKADERTQDVKLGWDAKRDRWNGYEADEYNDVVEEYNALEEMKKAAAVGKDGQKLLTEDGEEVQGGVDQGVKYEEEADMGRQQATSTRNLRLREDTAKYLLNLDLESAKYDPKTRSMEKVENDAAAEDGFERAAGDAADDFERAQKYAWEAQERGDKNAIHLQANPTAGEVNRKKQQEEESTKKEASKKALLAKYGGQQHLQRDPLKDATVTENERYVEYDERGKLKGAPEKKEKSMYAEDVFINNHTSVWGSWWKDFQWGYKCCHSIIKHSYCVGDEGMKTIEEATQFSRGATTTGDEELEADQATEVPRSIAWREEADSERHVPNAVDKPERAKRDAGLQQSAATKKKRTLEEMRGEGGAGTSATEEEQMDEYRRKRTSANDPMANLLGRDELVG